MHEKAQFVFWLTLILYVFTVLTVSYVGVYLTYIVIPIIVISGLIVKLTKPSKKPSSELVKQAQILGENFSTALNNVLSGLEEVTQEMSEQSEAYYQRVKQECEEKRKELSRMDNWAQWKIQNKENLDHIAGYEEAFVDNVLSQIEEISPEDVISQYHFVDATGKNRYIDFVIKNKEKNYFLPIEVDGYSKMQMGYGKFDDFLVRQNALLEQFGFVLRYSNKKMLHQPGKVVAEIRKILNLQKKGELTSTLKKEIYESQLEKYRVEIEKLKQKEQQHLTEMKNKLSQLTQKAEQSEKEKKLYAEQIKRYQSEIKRLQSNDQTQITAAVAKLDELMQKAAESNQEQLAYCNEMQSYRIELARLKAKEEENKEKISQVLKALEYKNNNRYPRQKLTTHPHKTSITSAQMDDIQHNKSSVVITVTLLVILFAGLGVFIYYKQSSTYEESLSLNSTKQQSIDLAYSDNTSQEVDMQQALFDVPNVNNDSSQAQSTDALRISTIDAKSNIGAFATVCGEVMQLQEFSKGVYVNFDGKYPNHYFTALIWNTNASLIEQAPRWYKKSLCLTGKITQYKGRPQMIINSQTQVVRQ